MPKVIDLPTVTSISYSDYLIMEQSGGGTRKITYQNVLPSKNVIQYSPSVSANTIEDGNHDITSFSLSAGIWIVTGQVSVMGGGNYRVGCGISTASGDLQPSGGGSAIVRASNSDWTVINVARILALGNTTTVYLVGTQDSGSAKSINRYDTNMRAVRVG